MTHLLAALLPLTVLRVGQVARVVHVLGDSRCVDHLREVGLCAGAEVEMLRGGSPCIVRLDGQRLCLRADELASVMVAPQDAKP
jgi:ferrous iron transport protein A